MGLLKARKNLKIVHPEFFKLRLNIRPGIICWPVDTLHLGVKSDPKGQGCSPSLNFPTLCRPANFKFFETVKETAGKWDLCVTICAQAGGHGGWPPLPPDSGVRSKSIILRRPGQRLVSLSGVRRE